MPRAKRAAAKPKVSSASSSASAAAAAAAASVESADSLLAKIAAVARLNREELEVVEGAEEVVRGHSYKFYFARAVDPPPAPPSRKRRRTEVDEEEEEEGGGRDHSAGGSAAAAAASLEPTPNVERASKIRERWRYSGPELQAVEDVFNDHLDYSLRRFADLARLNDGIEAVANKFRRLADKEENRKDLRVFLTNLEHIQVAIGELRGQLLDEPEKLTEIAREPLQELGDAYDKVAKVLKADGVSCYVALADWDVTYEIVTLEEKVESLEGKVESLESNLAEHRAAESSLQASVQTGEQKLRSVQDWARKHILFGAINTVSREAAADLRSILGMTTWFS